MAAAVGGAGGGAGAAAAGAPALTSLPAGAVVDVTGSVDKRGAFLLNAAGSTTATDVLGGVIAHSDAGPQFVLHLPFIEPMRLSSIVVTSPAGEEPALLKVFVNRIAFDFGDAEDEATQAFPLTKADMGKELKLKAAKFAVSNAITLFFDNEEAERIGLSRVRINGAPIAKADVSKIQKC